MQYEIHEVAMAFPSLKDTDPETYISMVEDMRKNGYVGPPVVLHDGKIIDGRTRYEAWQESGGNGDLPTSKYKGKPEALAHYAFNANAQRRHLTHLQKAVIYLKMFSANAEKPDFTIPEFVETSGIRYKTAALAVKLWAFNDQKILDQCVDGTLSETEATEIAASQEVVASKAECEEESNRREFYEWVDKLSDGGVYTKDTIAAALGFRKDVSAWFVRCCDIAPDVRVIRGYGKRQMRQFQFQREEVI